MKILIPISGRSDAGVVQPIIKRLKERGHHITHEHHYDCLEDVVLICGDRTEMVEIAYRMFLHHIPIAHLYAGVTNTIATFDDINRHCITLWSDVQFCENKRAFDTVGELCLSIDKAPNRYNVGITHLDDLEVDESQCPQGSYNLILYNPPTLTTTITTELDEILTHLWGTQGVWVAPNQDEGREKIIAAWPKHWSNLGMKDYPRPQFLGLLKNCRRFITNSSCVYYEAPHFLKPEQILHIGLRNKERSSKGPLQPGASDKIVTILEELYGP